MIVPILTGIISSILTVKIMNFVNKVQVREAIKNDRLFCSALDNIRFSTDWLLQLFEPILRYYNGPHYNYPGKMKGKFDTVEFAFHDEQMKKITAFYEDNKKILKTTLIMSLLRAIMILSIKCQTRLLSSITILS